MGVSKRLALEGWDLQKMHRESMPEQDHADQPAIEEWLLRDPPQTKPRAPDKEVDRLRMKDWAEEDRPREKMLEHGCSILSNAELLAIMIGCGSTKETVLDLSKRIMKEVNGDLDKLGKLSVAEFCRFHGIGKVKAVTIVAALELGRRRKNAEESAVERILSPIDILHIFQPILSDLPHEEFWIALLNQRNQVMRKVKVSQGGTASTVVDIKLVVRPAVEQMAAGVIAVHNHPSGSLSASKDDKELTIKIRKALAFFDIVLLDHVIISGKKYLSLANEGLC